MTALDPRLDGWMDALVERIQGQLRSELGSFTAQLSEAVERRESEAARDARASAEAAANALLTDAIAAERARAAQESDAARAEAHAQAAEAHSTIDRLSAEIADLQTRLEQEASRETTAALVDVRGAERQAELGTISALGEACRAFDAAARLSDVLTILIDRASTLVSRSALLIVRSGSLRGWEWRGFEGVGDAPAVEIGASDRTPVARAWQSGALETSTPEEVGGHVLSPRTAGRVGVAIPLTIAGEVVGVLYGDDDGERRQVPSAWPEQLEMLARYAGRCLESVTVRGVPGLLRASADERARAQIAQQDEESALRYARLLVAEIRLYHEAALDEGRRAGDILRRLRPQIERAQALYNERVPAALRARTTYFEDELVRTLAGGDQALLGQST